MNHEFDMTVAFGKRAPEKSPATLETGVDVIISPLRAPFIPSQQDLSPTHRRKVNDSFLLRQPRFIVANVTTNGGPFGYSEEAGDEAHVVVLENFVTDALTEEKEELFLGFLQGVGLGSVLQHLLEGKGWYVYEMPRQRLAGTDLCCPLIAEGETLERCLFGDGEVEVAVLVVEASCSIENIVEVGGTVFVLVIRNLDTIGRQYCGGS